jgi:hypothetical protein
MAEPEWTDDHEAVFARIRGESDIMWDGQFRHALKGLTYLEMSFIADAGEGHFVASLGSDRRKEFILAMTERGLSRP